MRFGSRKRLLRSFPLSFTARQSQARDGGPKAMYTVLTPPRLINSCFSKMSSYRIMETVTNERSHYDGNKKIHQEFSVCQVEDYSFVNLDSEYSFIGKTDEEKSLVCLTSEVPPNVIRRDDGWKALRIQGVLEFSLIGILSKIAAILADHNIPILQYLLTIRTIFWSKRRITRKRYKRLKPPDTK